MRFEKQLMSKKLHDKTEKSIYNIIIGHKTHQTYFDAVIQNLLPVYGLYQKQQLSFESFLKTFENQSDDFESFPKFPFFYEASKQSFITLQLLVQTVSHLSYKNKMFVPITNQFTVQQQVRYLISTMKKENPDYYIERFKLDLSKLLDDIYQLCGHCECMYLLTGCHTEALSDYEMSKTLNISQSQLEEQLIIEKNAMMQCLKNHQYHYLNACYYRMPLHINTNKTYKLLKNGYDIEHIAKALNVRLHTIQDHLLEILIKDYPMDISSFISENEINAIQPIYGQYGKLKSYYEQTNLKDYFKIKIAIILLSKGATYGLE